MGDINYQLVPPAILYLHPEGLNRQEFLNELYKIKARDYSAESEESLEIGSYYPFSGYLPDGIYSLGSFLELDRRSDIVFYPLSLRRGTISGGPLMPGYQIGEKTYFSWENMVEEHPELHPDKMHDWSKKNGRFEIPLRVFVQRIKEGKYSGRVEHYHSSWTQRDGKYFLDEMHSYPEHIWTSIVLTSEAIKQKAWGTLGYNHAGPTKVLERFLQEYPESRHNHLRSILTYNLTHLGKERGWSPAETWQEIARAYQNAVRNEFVSSKKPKQAIEQKERRKIRSDGVFSYPFSEEIEHLWERRNPFDPVDLIEQLKGTPKGRILKTYEEIRVREMKNGERFPIKECF